MGMLLILFLEKDQTSGTIAVGQIADLVVLNSNPLTNITNTQDIYNVIILGSVLDPSSL